ncbi:hypothetical protein ACEWY4_001608 [Coilia grayii]|uniref:Ig-like domain-containing protein n=1 Tax=Coilia grayii TaxID=363190 RepID=A0ABD1KTF9_9TELE
MKERKMAFIPCALILLLTCPRLVHMGVLYFRDGGTATLPCDSEGSPNCSSVSWYDHPNGWFFSDRKIWPDLPPDRAERLSLLPDCSLHITNVTTEDAGDYRCKNHLSGRSNYLFLQVLTGVLYSHHGGTATLPCDNVGSPNCSSVSWYKYPNGLQLYRRRIWPKLPPDRAERLSLLPDCSFHITNVTAEDAGRYRCENHLSGRSEILRLFVLNEVLYVRDGGIATLPCDSEGSPNCSSVSWYDYPNGWMFSRRKLWPDLPPDRPERLSLLPNCSLHITNVTAEDAGDYRCENHLSGRSEVLHLFVLDGKCSVTALK